MEMYKSPETHPESNPADYYRNPERLRQDDIQQAVFCDTIEQLKVSDIGLLPDFSEETDHRGGRRSATAVRSALDATGAQAMLTPQLYDNFAERELSFAPDPLLRIGKEDSRRQIFFGEMTANSLEHGETQHTSVAVSTIPSEKDVNKHGQSLHEISMYQCAASLDIPSLEVLGVVVTDAHPDMYGFVLTKYDPDISTIDTLDWSNMSQKEVTETLAYAVDTLALLHTNYLFHGDSAFRNIAVKDSIQKPIVVDLELSGSLRQETENIMKLSRFMSADFSSLAMSLDQNISRFYQNDSGLPSSTDRFDFMHNHIFLPYQDRLIQHGVTPLDPLGLAYDNVVSRRLDEAVGDEGRWRHV